MERFEARESLHGGSIQLSASLMRSPNCSPATQAPLTANQRIDRRVARELRHPKEAEDLYRSLVVANLPLIREYWDLNVTLAGPPERAIRRI
jgi:hypothetical protein